MIPEFVVLVLVPAVLIAGFAIFAVFTHMPLLTLGWHFAAALVGLSLGFLLFARGLVGGGDAKLFASVALWFGFPDIFTYAVIASVFGGALTLFLLLFRRLPLPKLLASQAWLAKLHDHASGVPYGVALASGAFAVLPYTDVFRTGLAG